ncbi:FixH family protein [Parageobacillus thermoglucosidasius]|uniref:FixH family protein n=1 Tax=Parageobacillus thermoglucosidasius TaxID=1426 RepID=UPI002E215C90|nr:FixH family protein [Parageobacillus thermoglucosidasius]MED4913651.1 FixH family protein [Parageobacillus thermoglucosidasius]MED4944953.1 FixH family protein [Parageobacillus thermoglucosidasius]MED4983438.1 FixH family protein [Parageobacillus thermoglucosidasius]
MKKIAATIFVCILFLVSCNKGDWEVSVKTKPFYKEGVSAPFVVEIKENGKPASGLTVHAVFEMANMDHGTITTTLKEKGDGIYEGKVQLPMEGEWETLLRIKNGKQTVEKLIKMQVKKEDAVAKINGLAITTEDVRFYQTLAQIEIAIGKETDQAKYKGEEFKERLAYWKRQEQHLQQINPTVTHLIELHSMALLAKEKGYSVAKNQIAKEVLEQKQQYDRYKVAKEIIHQYGEKKFWKQHQQHTELTLLAKEVWNDMMQQAKKENPNAVQTEIRYLAQKKYEELLISQVDSLQIELYIPNKS